MATPNRKPAKQNVIAALPAAFRVTLFENLGGVGGSDKKSTWTYDEARAEILSRYRKKVSRSQLHKWYKLKGSEEMQQHLYEQLFAAKQRLEDKGVPLTTSEMLNISSINLTGLLMAGEDTSDAAHAVKALTAAQKAETEELKRKESVEHLKQQIVELTEQFAKGPGKGESAEGHRAKTMATMDELFLGVSAGKGTS